MTDLETAIEHLDGHSICLCRDGVWLTDDSRGISPMMKLIASGKNLNGYAAADTIVGRAAAMLFVKAGITAVHGKVMSEGAKTYLESRGIPCTFETLTDRIINRSGTDICPMEKAVAAITDENEGYNALLLKWNELRA